MQEEMTWSYFLQHFNRITLSDRNRIQTHYHLVSK